MRTARLKLALAAVRAAAWLIPKLPLPLVSCLAVAAGWGAWLLNGSGRRAVRSNLRVVLGTEPSRRQVGAVFVTAARNYGDLLCLRRFSDADLLRRIDVEGWENLTAALAAGHGAILASLHLGNIEVIGRAATLRGLRVVIPVERLDPPELLDVMLALRRQAGLICTPVGAHAFGRVREELAKNAIVGIGVDRLTVGTAESVNFCGQPTRLPIAAAVLALRTGAPLLPYASRRLAGHRFRVTIGPPLPVRRGGSLRADARTLTEQLFAALAVHLRANPTQWVIFRPVWEAECPDSA